MSLIGKSVGSLLAGSLLSLASMTGDPRFDDIPKRRLSPFKVLSSLFASSYFALHSRIIRHLFTLGDFITGFQSD